MAQHNVLGQAGEDAAAEFLANKGYIIRDRNWRMKHLELDIVATYGGELVIVEVKTRANTQWSNPHEAVNRTKMRRLMAAANAYVAYHEIDMPLRFDILEVVGAEKPFQITHIEDAFYPGI